MENLPFRMSEQYYVGRKGNMEGEKRVDGKLITQNGDYFNSLEGDWYYHTERQSRFVD